MIVMIWIAFIISFQNTYGYRGLRSQQAHAYWSSSKCWRTNIVSPIPLILYWPDPSGRMGRVKKCPRPSLQPWATWEKNLPQTLLASLHNPQCPYGNNTFQKGLSVLGSREFFVCYLSVTLGMFWSDFRILVINTWLNRVSKITIEYSTRLCLLSCYSFWAAFFTALSPPSLCTNSFVGEIQGSLSNAIWRIFPVKGGGGTEKIGKITPFIRSKNTISRPFNQCLALFGPF